MAKKLVRPRKNGKTPVWKTIFHSVNEVFWEWLGLESVGKQVSETLIKARVKALIPLAVIAIGFSVAGYWFRGKADLDTLQSENKVLMTANYTNVALINHLQSELTEIRFERDQSVLALKAKATNLARQIAEYIEVRKKNDPMPANRWAEFVGLKSEQREARVFEQDQQQREYDERMKTQFVQKYLGRLNNLRDQIADYGLPSVALDSAIAHPSMSIYVDEVPAELQKLVAKLQ